MRHASRVEVAQRNRSCARVRGAEGGRELSAVETPQGTCSEHNESFLYALVDGTQEDIQKFG
jgi:hypothetical protein